MKPAKNRASIPVNRTTLPFEKAAKLRSEILGDRINALAKIVKGQRQMIEGQGQTTETLVKAIKAQTELIETQQEWMENMAKLVDQIVYLMKLQDLRMLRYMGCPEFDM